MSSLCKALHGAIFKDMVVYAAHELHSIDISAHKQLVAQTIIFRAQDVVYKFYGAHLPQVVAYLSVVVAEGVVYAAKELRKSLGGFADHKVVTLTLATVVSTKTL